MFLQFFFFSSHLFLAEDLFGPAAVHFLHMLEGEKLIMTQEYRAARKTHV